MTPESTKQKYGVLVMAYGSPESIGDLEPYLLDIRGGRETPRALVEEIKDRYQLIGGRSPLLDLTRRQAKALETALNQRFTEEGVEIKSYVGMRHWEPRIKEAVGEMIDDGVKKAAAVVMAPHSSRMSTGAYFRHLDQAVSELGADIEFNQIEHWHNHPGLIAAIDEKARAAMRQFDQTPYVIFTAHSLPTRILSQGDPYDDQLKETACLLAESLGLAPERWQFSYQSAGQSAEPWLGPQIEEVVVRLAEAGERNLLVVPVGFVCDHVEILYDIDIAARVLASQYGVRLERSESLNNSPLFINTLADLVAQAIGDTSRDRASQVED